MRYWFITVCFFWQFENDDCGGF